MQLFSSLVREEGEVESYTATTEEIELGSAAIRASVEAIYHPERRTDVRASDPKQAQDSTPRLLFARIDLLWHGDTVLVSEVEALDASLFFRFSDECVSRMCSAILRRLRT